MMTRVHPLVTLYPGQCHVHRKTDMISGWARETDWFGMPLSCSAMVGPGKTNYRQAGDCSRRILEQVLPDNSG
jgi:hypothetical protein